MNRLNRKIIGIVFVTIFLVTSFYFLPQESKFYLKSDVSELKNSLLPVSILTSIILAYITVFRKSEFSGSKWNKTIYVGYIGIMSCLVFNITSDFLTTIVLKTNRISSTEKLNKNFVMSTFTVTTNGKITESGPWVIKSENNYEIRGKLSDKLYENDVDGIFIDKQDFAKIEQKKEFAITLTKGLLGIPFEPILIE